MDLESYLMLPQNLAAIQSVAHIFQVKKAMEKAIGCKISFDQFGEIIELAMTRPSVEVMKAGLSRILQGS